MASGNIIPIKNNNISLEKEVLNIKFSPLKTEVDILYKVKSHKNKKTKLEIGFPHLYGFKNDYYPGRIHKLTNNGNLENIQIYKNNNKVSFKVLKWNPQNKGKLFSKKYLLLLSNDYDEYGYKEKHSFAETILFSINLKPLEIFNLRIKYQANNFSYILGSNAYMSRFEYYPYRFKYILKTGKLWKNGVIKNFECNLKINDCTMKNLIVKPDSLVKHKKDYLSWKKNNFKPTENINIKYYPTEAIFVHTTDGIFTFDYELIKNSYKHIVDKDFNKYNKQITNSDNFVTYKDLHTYSVAFFEKRKYKLESIKILNKKIKKLTLFLQINHDKNDFVEIKKITLTRKQNTFHFKNINGKVDLFAIPKIYPKVTQHDIELKIKYIE